MNSEINTTFTGTVDQLLNYCNTLNFDISDEQVKSNEYESCISYIMDSQEVDRNEAIEIYKMIALEETKQHVDKLVNEGLLEISDYTEDGEPKFALTALGKQCAEHMKKNTSKNV